MRKYIFLFVSILFFCLCNPSGKNSQSADNGKEKYRPALHFTPPAAWMNDPNGMVYFDGEYHLFYQHYPDSTIWGPMHWGHAVSSDLLHWKHLPVALYPDSLGYIFSGSAVADIDNTSGLGTREKPALVAIYTYHDPVGEKAGRNDFQTQGIAFSTDKGRTWQKYKNNPVLRNPGIRDFRDPKVAWNPQVNKWIMVLAAGDRIKFYSSPNLIDWTFESDFGENIGAHGGVWECPDLFPLKAGNQTKWVLLVSINPGGPNGGSATQYFVGDFDGKKFSVSNKEHKWLDYGKDNYAGVTWSNVPDGRTLFIGWMSNWQYANVVPTEKWRSAATIARELSLEFDGESYSLVSLPVRELKSIARNSFRVDSMLLQSEKEFPVPEKFVDSPFMINISFQIPQGSFPDEFGLVFGNGSGESVKAGYNPSRNELFFDRSRPGNTSFSDDFAGVFKAPCKLNQNSLQLQLIFDETSLEIFAQDGRVVLTNIFFPTEVFNRLKLYSAKGDVVVSKMEITSLHPVF